MFDSVRPHRQQPTRLLRPWDSPGLNTGVGFHFLLQCMKVKSESEVTQCVRLLATPWTAALQAPPSMGFSRQGYWSGVPLPFPGQRSWMLLNTGQLPQQRITYAKMSLVPHWEMSTQFALHQHNLEGGILLPHISNNPLDISLAKDHVYNLSLILKSMAWDTIYQETGLTFLFENL